MNGWISPKGEYFPCEFSFHYETAENLAEQNGYKIADGAPCDDELVETYGWIKAYRSFFGSKTMLYGPSYPATEAQKEFITNEFLRDSDQFFATDVFSIINN